MWRWRRMGILTQFFFSASQLLVEARFNPVKRFHARSILCVSDLTRASVPLVSPPCRSDNAHILPLPEESSPMALVRSARHAPQPHIPQPLTPILFPCDNRIKHLTHLLHRALPLPLILNNLQHTRAHQSYPTLQAPLLLIVREACRPVLQLQLLYLEPDILQRRAHPCLRRE